MTADDLSAPLGQQPKKRRRAITIPVPQILVGALALFLGVFVLWAVVADDPFGGEPMAIVPANLHLAAKTPDVSAAPQPVASSAIPQQPDGAQVAAPASATPGPAPNTTTVTIIDGKTGARQEVQVPAPTATSSAAAAPAMAG